MCRDAGRAARALVRMVLVWLALWGIAAQAASYMDGKVQVHGFLTQGAVFTSDNNFLGSSDNGSLDFRELGLNASWRPDPDWQFSAQVLSHRSGEIDEGHLRLDYAMLDWTLVSAEQGRAGIRVGRVKNYYGLYNTTRDVAFTRPSVILPQSIYFESARNLEMSADGLSAYAEHYGEAGNLYLRYGAGYGQVGDKSIEAAFLGRNLPGKFDSNLLQLVNITWEEAEGRYLLGLTSVWGSMDYEPAAGDFLQSGRVDFHPIIVSAQYNWDKWSLTAEHFFEYLRYEDFGFLLPDRSPVAQSYYVQGSYRPTPKWEAFLRYDVFYPDRDDRDGKDYAAVSSMPAYTAYAKDWTLGVRHDVTENFMVRAEYHRVEGTAWLSSLENISPLTLEKRWDMLMLLASYRF